MNFAGKVIIICIGVAAVIALSFYYIGGSDNSRDVKLVFLDGVSREIKERGDSERIKFIDLNGDELALAKAQKLRFVNGIRQGVQGQRNQNPKRSERVDPIIYEDSDFALIADFVFSDVMREDNHPPDHIIVLVQLFSGGESWVLPRPTISEDGVEEADFPKPSTPNDSPDAEQP